MHPMDGNHNGRGTPRVVVLSRRAVPNGAGARTVPVASAYEAAAEILAAPAAVLVIDLGLVRPRDGRLVEIARQMAVEVLATGPLPAGLSADELSGVRLVAERDLPEAIEAVVATDAEAAPHGMADLLADVADQPLQEAETLGEYLPVTEGPVIEPRPASGQAVAEPADAERVEPERQLEPEPRCEPATDEPPAEPEDHAAEAPTGLLTPEELAALLENEP